MIDGNELEGLEWESIHTKRTDGSNQVTFKVNVKVMNNSDRSDGEFYQLAFDIAGQVEQSYYGFDSETNTHYNTVVTLDFDSEIDTQNDYYMEFVRKVENTETGKPYPAGTVGEGVGNTQVGRIQVRADKYTDSHGVPRTGAHEFGHTTGMGHPNKQNIDDKTGIKLEANNIMRQSEETHGTLVNIDQLKHINKQIDVDRKKY